MMQKYQGKNFCLPLIRCGTLRRRVCSTGVPPGEVYHYFGIRIFGELQRGDIAVFKHENRIMVKRIAGIGGDIVYTAPNDVWAVPLGCYFMLGDNEEVSRDSRHWENPFVSTGDIVAKVWAE